MLDTKTKTSISELCVYTKSDIIQKDHVHGH